MPLQASTLQEMFSQTTDEIYVMCFTVERWDRAIIWNATTQAPDWPVRLCTNTEVVIEGPAVFQGTTTGALSSDTLSQTNTDFHTTVGVQAGARIIRTSGSGSPQSGLVVSSSTPTSLTTSGITWTGSGQTYDLYRLFAPAAIDVVMPDDEPEGTPQLRATLLGPQYDLVERLRAIPFAPIVRADIVLLSSPSVVERTESDLKLRHSQAVGNQMTFEMRYDELVDEPVPGYRFSPQLFPGLF